MSDDIVIEETMGSKLFRIAIKSAAAGVVGYVFVRVMNGTGGGATLPVIGNVSGATALGTAIGAGKFIAEVLEEFVLDPDTSDSYNEMLMNLFSPLLAACIICSVPIAAKSPSP